MTNWNLDSTGVLPKQRMAVMTVKPKSNLLSAQGQYLGFSTAPSHWEGLSWALQSVYSHTENNCKGLSANVLGEVGRMVACPNSEHLWMGPHFKKSLCSYNSIKDCKMRSSYINWWALNPMTSILIRDRRKLPDSRERGHVKTRTKWRWCRHEASWQPPKAPQSRRTQTIVMTITVLSTCRGFPALLTCRLQTSALLSLREGFLSF